MPPGRKPPAALDALEVVLSSDRPSGFPPVRLLGVSPSSLVISDLPRRMAHSGFSCGGGDEPGERVTERVDEADVRELVLDTEPGTEGDECAEGSCGVPPVPPPT